MPKLARLRHFFVPAIIGLLIVIAAGWYNLVWLPSEQKYLDDRNFRTLTTLSDQISASINTFDKMLDHASDSGVTSEMLPGYLQKVAPQLRALEDSQDQQVIGGDYGDPPNMTVSSDEGTHFLYLAFQRNREKPDTENGAKTKANPKAKVKTEIEYGVRTDLDRLIRELLPPDNRNPFDVVLVAQSDGTVIFQSSSSVLTVANIDSLDDDLTVTKTAQPDSGPPKTGQPEPHGAKATPQSKRYSASRFSESILAGSPYRIYSRPLQLSFPLLHPEGKSANGKNTLRPPEQWVVCGLVSVRAFRSESQSISYSYVLWLSAIILLAIAAYPFLKLLVASPSERLRASDIFVTAVLTCVAAATLTFALLDGYFWRKNFDEPAELQMHKLAAAINENFGRERTSAFKQLKDFYSGGTLSYDLRQASSTALTLPNPSPEQLPTFSKVDGNCDPDWACRTEILTGPLLAARPSAYPYLQLAAWNDSSGNQWVKWSPRNHVTPFINLDDPSTLYYRAVRRAFEYPGGPHPAPSQGIGSQYSSNTGGNIAVFWRLMDVNGNPVSASTRKQDVFCASLVTRPISVVDPVMPAGFEFAIIRNDGTVVFHSDSTRNLRENFFAETDQNQKLRSRVLMRAAGPLFAKYMGRGHRLYISPMSANLDQANPDEPWTDEPWTVVVFRDLRIEETTNLEVLSLASILFVLYAVAIALALLLAHWTQRGQATGSWLWPDSRKAAKYRLLVIINIAAILLLFVLPKLPWVLALLILAVCIPAGAVVFNVVWLKRESDGLGALDGAKETGSSRWQLGYAGTFAALLVVVAFMPCLSFFKVAWDFEHRLLVERSHLRLINDFKTRRQKVRSTYAGVELGDYAPQLLAGPEQVPPLLFSYHQSFLHTEITSTREDQGTPPAPCGLASACDQQRRVESLLSTSSPLYNQLASDGRYLTEASLDIPMWSSIPSGGQEQLTLTKQEPDKKSRTTITSVWQPLNVLPANGFWWLGTLAYLGGFFCLVWFSLRRFFLLDLPAPDGGQSPPTVLEPDNLITKLARNMLVIGHGSSPAIVNLVKRKEVYACDLYDLLKAPMQMAATSGGGSVEVKPANVPVGEIAGKIVQFDRPVVFQDFERGLDDPAIRQEMLSTLEIVLSTLHKPVVITSRVDPLAKSAGDQRKRWQTLLQSFVRKDLNSCPAPRAGETAEQFEGRISSGACYDWLFSSLSKAQKLVLVHLAQERIVNPNCRHAVQELIGEGLIVRPYGMLTIRDDRFSQFLKSDVPRSSIKHWEKQGAGTHSDTLRISLGIAGAAVVGFLLYTQGAIWLTYATGLATAVPTIMKLYDGFRGGSPAAAQVH